MSDCLFCRIVNGEIPASKIYEDEDIVAFNDVNPVAPVHFMIIPKLHVASLSETDGIHQALLGKMLLLAPRLAKEQGCNNGFRTIINTGHVGGQEIFHLHIHVIGGDERLPRMIHSD